MNKPSPSWFWRRIGLMLAAAAAVVLAAACIERQVPTEQSTTVPQVSASAVPKTVPMASYEEVRQEYENRRKNWQTEVDDVSRKHRNVSGLRYELMTVETLLRHASLRERDNLATILQVSPETDPADLVYALRKAGSHSVVTLVRMGRPVEYEEVVADVARTLGANDPLPLGSQVQLEGIAIRTALEKVLKGASPQQRRAILDEMAKAQGVPTTALVTASGAMILANLSGFGLYMGASTALGAISSAVGVSLPFVVYTGMSSVLAVAIGPVGWATLTAAAAYKIGGTNYKKTIPGVLLIASSRSRLTAERDAEIAVLDGKRKELDRRAEGLAVLARFMNEMQRAGPGHQVPRSTVPW